MYPESKPFATPENLHPGDVIWVATRKVFEKSPIHTPAKPYTVVEVTNETFSVNDSYSGTTQPIQHHMQTGMPLTRSKSLAYTVTRSNDK